MIPAILSCVFVIHLYRMLNQGDVGSPIDGKSASAATPDVLSDRIQQIQERLNKLAKGPKS